MGYSISKQVTAKKKLPFRVFWQGLVVLVAIPVIIIGMLGAVIYYVFSRVKLVLTNGKARQAEEPFHIALELLNKKQVQITAVEDELDAELTSLNEQWEKSVYHEGTYLYRAKTSPHVAGVEGKIVCFYLKEMHDGALLQVLTEPLAGQPLSTELLYLPYHSLHVTAVGDAGAFHLYNDPENAGLIKGFSNEEEISIELIRS